MIDFENDFPWQQGPLDEWSICGMNHYHVKGKRFLFVSMTKDGRCISTEGEDDRFIWNRLCHMAWDSDKTEIKC